MATQLSPGARLKRKLPRVLKYCRQYVARVTDRTRPTPRPVFVLGAQRSGTRLPLVVLERSPEIITFNEGSAPFFSSVLLREDDVIHRNLGRLPFPIVVIKPICESHRGPELLDTFPGSKAIWIYRDYRDTVNSMVEKWQTGVMHLRNLARGDLQAAGWRAGGLTADEFAIIRRVYDDRMSLHAANAVMWYLRTSLFFDRGLSTRNDVLLVKYEDLVRHPSEQFPRLFEFLECPFASDYLTGVHASSIRSKPFPEMPKEIAAMCGNLMERLDSHYAAQVRRPVESVR
jgi:hypothetical protein